jgi:hypothetical protein
MKKLMRVLPAFLAIFVVSGCASVSLLSSWKDPGATAKQYRNLLVVGITDKTQTRQIFEEVFASEIGRRGVAGIPSYTYTGVEEKPSRASLEQAVKKSGADGVITTRMVEMKSDTAISSGFIMTDRGYTNSSFSGDGIYPTELFDFYGTSVSYASFVHQRVEITESTKATIETNLFDTGTGRLVWSCISNAVDPEGIITVSRELADGVVRAMARDGLI